LFFIYLTVRSGTCTAPIAVCQQPGACVSVPVKKVAGLLTIGEVIQKGKYSMVMDARCTACHRAKMAWVYFRIERDDLPRDLCHYGLCWERATAEAGRNA